MGISLPTDMRFAGFRGGDIKSTLNSIKNARSAWDFATLRSAESGIRDRAILIEELLDRNLIAPHRGWFALTEEGKALASASARARTPIGRARELLSELLERVSAFNNVPDSLLQVDRVWVFGSTMRGEDTVGDIDITVETSRRPPFDKDFQRYRRRLDADLKKAGVSEERRSGLNPVGEGWLVDRAIFGARRHPVFSKVPEANLEALGVPCQLVFDRSRGGVVDDPVSPRHPRSDGRRESMRPPVEMPELTPSPIRPMHANWLCSWSGAEMSYVGRLVGSEAPGGAFEDFSRGLEVVSKDLPARGARRRGSQSAGLDGRERVLLKLSDGDQSIDVLLQRSIIEQEDGTIVDVRLERVDFDGGPGLASNLVIGLATAVALLASGDAQRVLRRSMDSGSDRQVVILLDVLEHRGHLGENIAVTAKHLIDGNIIKAQPTGWVGDDVFVEVFKPKAAALSL